MMRAGYLALGAAAALAAYSVGNAASSDTLASRVQALEDEKEIHEVIVKYGEYLDARDYRAYAELFSSDGVWSGGFGSYTGPAAIEAMLAANMGTHAAGYINKDNFHLNTTVVVDVEGDTATARSRYLFITRTEENRPNVALAGRYVDELVREDGAWKIKTRKSHGVIPYRDGDQPPPAQPPAAVSGLRPDSN